MGITKLKYGNTNIFLLGEMNELIVNNKLDLKLPLIKEIKMHIAVAKAFTI